MANKYTCQLRRGWKGIDRDGNTTYVDGTPIDDWARYEEQAEHVKPLPGELVLEYDNGVPRLKIGDGINEFSALPYMSVDSFILPTQATITVDPDKWETVQDENGDVISNRYYQYVDVANATVTPKSKVDLQITPKDLMIFAQKDLTFTTINANNKVRVCVVGQKPEHEYTFKATVTEMDLTTEVSEIIGNATATALSKEAIVELIKSTVAELLGSD